MKFFALVLLLALAACTAPTYEPPPAARPVAKPAPAQPPPPTGATVMTPAPEVPPLPPPEPIPPPAPPPSSGATAALLQQGRQHAAAGNYAMATSSLERALRINPRDAELWLELGQVKLKQGDRGQAANMGRRALALAGGDAALRSRCEDLIAAANAR